VWRKSLLIVKENEILGYCLFRDDKEYIYIRQLYVEKNKRKMGLGKACIQWLKSNLWIDRTIRMDVLSNNKDGIEFWRKMGFKDYCITMEM
jgi:ribosomal protein S18 acetylase RimI-like enzyme